MFACTVGCVYKSWKIYHIWMHDKETALYFMGKCYKSENCLFFSFDIISLLSMPSIKSWNSIYNNKNIQLPIKLRESTYHHSGRLSIDQNTHMSVLVLWNQSLLPSVWWHISPHLNTNSSFVQRGLKYTVSQAA